jgi:putative membrane protein
MYMNGHMIWMALWWIFELAVVVVVLWLLFNAFRGPVPRNESAEDILKRRLAAGEIDIEEYERHLRALSKSKSAA